MLLAMGYINCGLILLLTFCVLNQSYQREDLHRHINTSIQSADDAKLEVQKLRKELAIGLKEITSQRPTHTEEQDPVVKKKQEATWPAAKKSTCFRFSKYGDKVAYDCTTGRDIPLDEDYE